MGLEAEVPTHESLVSQGLKLRALCIWKLALMGIFVVQRCARAKILTGKQVFELGNSVEHLLASYFLPGVQ